LQKAIFIFWEKIQIKISEALFFLFAYSFFFNSKATNNSNLYFHITVMDKRKEIAC